MLIPRASLQRRAFAEGAAVDRFLNSDRRSDGIESVILVRGDRIAGDQHRVPLELRNNAAVSVDHRRHRAEIFVQRLRQLLRGQILGNGRKSLDVGEQHHRHLGFPAAALERMKNRGSNLSARRAIMMKTYTIFGAFS